MVNLGELNSRLKDFYDIWLLARQCEFRLENLKGAVERTFEKRGTEIPEVNPFSAAFVDSKQLQWQAFRKRLGQDHVPEVFSEIVEVVVEFLSPVMASRAADTPWEIWYPPGPWSRQADG